MNSLSSHTPNRSARKNDIEIARNLLQYMLYACFSRIGLSSIAIPLYLAYSKQTGLLSPLLLHLLIIFRELLIAKKIVDQQVVLSCPEPGDDLASLANQINSTSLLTRILG